MSSRGEEERQRKKAEVEGAIARMVTDSMMRVEVAMEKDRAGKNLKLGFKHCRGKI